ncbi:MULTISPECIES: AMP-binding protein [unclassified Crossiella]|uniref:AMP-binding protein n=1 Tax=unclassified Crossiella TaxID=2620835 RepID=UPI001FFE5C68|nr:MULTISPECIES: AMP-binding protein [unclassified Crossiella]MCK2236719.1 AMP-binding protein [Crossiella sp. S99.2]MCK2250387.1 AMP-binding protein [Crossiella sp. S99.1]
MTVVGNVADLIRSAALREADHPALLDAADGSQVSWGRLDSAVDAQAHRLRMAGALAGDRVAIRLPTGIEFCVALFGALRAGCVVVPLAPGLPGPELTRVLTDSGARLLVAEGEVPGIAGNVKVLPAPALAEAEPFETAGGDEDLAVLAYTSGTSGVPRGVMLSHRALVSNTRQCARLRPAPVTAADRVLLAIPLFHAYGLGPGLLQTAAAGATGVLLERFDAEGALAAIRRHRVTTFVGVPPMYTALLGLPEDELREGLATLRLLTSGAAPLDGEVLRRVKAATGLDVFEGYGLTETGPVLTSTLVTGVPKPGSVGQPLPEVELRLVDSDGTPLEEEDEGGAGLVSVRGPNLFSGYWPDGAHGPDAEGWFRTGDVGYLDEGGDLHLVDRANDLIIVNGFNVYPHEVEHVLGLLPGVVESAAVGVPDAGTGETVKVVVVRDEGAELTEADVVAHCASLLAKFKVPTKVEFVATLPHSVTGKLARRSLR